MSDGREDQTGQGHPLPDSAEARHEEIPEHLEREKGHGADERGPSQPEGGYVAPDGEAYGLRRDQAAHQDRGQSYIEDTDR